MHRHFSYRIRIYIFRMIHLSERRKMWKARRKKATSVMYRFSCRIHAAVKSKPKSFTHCGNDCDLARHAFAIKLIQRRVTDLDAYSELVHPSQGTLLVVRIIFTQIRHSIKQCLQVRSDSISYHCLILPLWLMNYVAHKASWQIVRSTEYSLLTSIYDTSPFIYWSMFPPHICKTSDLLSRLLSCTRSRCL